jgi:predicted acylesterase/phospholipase RssA
MVGTSAGAIFATCYAAGYSAREMLAEVSKRDDANRLIFAQFTAKPLLAQATEKERDIDWAQIVKAGFNKDIKKIRDEVMRSVPLQGLTDLLIERLAGKSVDAPRKGRAKAAGDKALSLLLLGATSDATPFLDWIKARLKDKKADPEITFKDFHQKFNADKGQQLSLVATDIKDQEVLILNHRTTPDLPVAWGVRMSMNIPFVWSSTAVRTKPATRSSMAAYWPTFRCATSWSRATRKKLACSARPRNSRAKINRLAFWECSWIRRAP